MAAKVLKCNGGPKCINQYQDGKYGQNMRVMNSTLKGTTASTSYRCTVCSTERSG